MDALLAALRDGKLCVVDVSQLRGGPSLVLSGLILRRIFDRNQDEFTKENPQSIPTIAVVEEAQSVLNDKASAAQPYIEWVKEGRKYDLGAMLITQQPGSIPGEILSQGDNWFVFHLLSAADLRSVKSANAHYSDDLLSSLLNEPIPGHGIFWSSADKRTLPIAFRAMLFEALYETVDKNYNAPAVETYASRLRARLRGEVEQAVASMGSPPPAAPVAVDDGRPDPETQPVDFRTVSRQKALETVGKDADLARPLNAGNATWGVVWWKLKDALPASIEDRDDFAGQLVPEFLDGFFGKGEWHTEKRLTKSKGELKSFIKKGRASQAGTA